MALVNLWILDCFQKAFNGDSNNISFFFKQEHDALEILDLKTGRILLEKSELEKLYKL